MSCFAGCAHVPEYSATWASCCLAQGHLGAYEVWLKYVFLGNMHIFSVQEFKPFILWPHELLAFGSTRGLEDPLL